MHGSWPGAIDALLNAGGPVVAEPLVYLEEREQLNISLDGGEIDELDCRRNRGAGVTGTEKGNTEHYCFTTPGRMCEEFGLDPAGEVSFSPENKDKMKIEIYPDFKPSPVKIDKLKEADRSARAAGEKIEQVKINYRERLSRVIIFRANKKPVREERVYLSFRVTTTAVANGRRERGFASAAGYCGEELFENNSPVELAEKAAARALVALEARPVKPGTKTVVIAPGFGGTIFHEACGHGFEADHIYEDASVYRGKTGRKVASELVNFVDDASLDNLNGSYVIDDEGEKGRRNVLINEGIMEGYLADNKYGQLLGCGSTGSGRRQSFREPVLPRMSNTYIEAGDADPEAIIGSTEDGIYAAHIGGGQVDPASGDFIFSADEAYRIENGKITTPVRDAALVGNGPEVLKRVDAVGNDLEFAPGSCGKGQWVPVSVGQPTLRVQDLRIGGDSDA